MSKENYPANFERWSQADDQLLIQMIHTKCNSEEIATALGRTRSAVMGRKNFLGIEMRMQPARGSKMPYTSFNKERRQLEEVEGPGEPTYVGVEQVVANRVEHSLDSMLEGIAQRAKSMGLKVKISFEIED